MIECMLQCGAYGAGQSSWGPALYGLVKESESKAVANKMRDFLTRNKKGGSVFVTRCSNRGARTYINNYKQLRMIQHEQYDALEQ